MHGRLGRYQRLKFQPLKTPRKNQGFKAEGSKLNKCSSSLFCIGELIIEPSLSLERLEFDPSAPTRPVAHRPRGTILHSAPGFHLCQEGCQAGKVPECHSGAPAERLKGF